MAPFELILLSTLAVVSTATPITNSDSLLPSQYHIDLPASQPYHYRCFENNTEAPSYPQPEEWLPFESFWKINQPAILSGNGGDTYAEHYLHEAIEQLSPKHKVDPRLVLAAVLQVSGGKVNAPCLGPSSIKCNQAFDTRDPRTSIYRMIEEGLDIVATADCWTAFADRFAPHADCGDPVYMSDIANRLLGWNGRKEGFESCQR